ncbi:hypothetical protein LEMLEM_LOCUS24107 [Lemmus lemmus]
MPRCCLQHHWSHCVPLVKSIVGALQGCSKFSSPTPICCDTIRPCHRPQNIGQLTTG